jgi:flavin-dependent dehydrogenase
VRVVSGDRQLEVDWPESSRYPDFGLVRRRVDLDQQLIEHAANAGARLHQETRVTGSIQDRQGRVLGVTASAPGGSALEFRAPLVLACDGASGRLAAGMWLHRDQRRPVGAAVRWYYRSPRSQDDYLEAWLLPARVHASTAFPGYGWIFGLGDGSVNVGLGRLPPQAGPHGPDLARVLTAWVGSLPADWGLCEENALSDPRGVGLPMGFTRRPQTAVRRRATRGR